MLKLPPLSIVYATTWFKTKKFTQNLEFDKRQCPIPEGYDIELEENDVWCTLTSSKENIQNASGLIFHAPDSIKELDIERIPNQPWILESLESPYSSLFRSDPDAMKRFDYLASYHFKSTFLFSYFSPRIMDVVNRPLPEDLLETKTKSAPILWIAKNCGATNKREVYIEKLMKYISVDSYGTCLNNKPFPLDKDRMQLLGEYKFYLSIENANCEDYVTEKLYDTFMMSTVPIVDGPKSYKGYIPNERSVIYLDAYPDPKELADYINYLDHNDTAYLEYLSYRTQALDIAAKDRLDPDFIDHWGDEDRFNKISSYCSICRGLLPWWSSRIDHKDYREPEKVFLTDTTCQPPGKWAYLTKGLPYIPDWTPRPRDEFTRPDYSPLVVSPPVDRSVFLGHVIFIVLYFLFLWFLYKTSKRLPL